MLNLTEKSFKTVIFKSLKKSVMAFLCAVMTIVTIPNIDVFADELNDNNKLNTSNETDLYAEKFVENISIEGDSYTYKYYYNENGDRSISVLNNTKSTVETITYDDESSNIYLDSKKVAEVVTADDTMHSVSRRAATKWKCLGSQSRYIKWYEAIGAGAVAAVLATRIPGLGASAIVASCGMGALNAIARGTVLVGAGGTLYWTTWSSKAGKFTRLKYDWAFKTRYGKRYGTYHCYDTI